ncbi:efflux RND transporter periplasmic adaptor subunit [Faecalispora anaeroviscerum]|uniref:efflux RND transporter periplasmic adaptor subunit n=1 Tax=Faecalispora anaeroviscerum TaxID=2991836 RepID=UPI0024B8E59B|nr:efflux RND transporter periplasmic adaptor subunit [Faecalispora anaeroviscerum]
MVEKLKSIGQFAAAHKKMAIIVCLGVVVVTGGAVWFTVWRSAQSAQQTVSYRESTVTKGDVTVGVSESGTVSLDSESISFPVDSDIAKVLVKSGTTVKKGDALIQLDLNSVSEGSLETRQKLEAAKLSLQKALSDQTVKLEEAKITYESSQYLSQTASVTRQLTEEQLQNNIATAELTLKEAKESLEEYQTLQKSFSADYTKLNQLEKWMDDAKTAKTSYETQLEEYTEDHKTVIDRYDSLVSAAETAKTEWLQAKYAESDDEDDLKDGYDEAEETAEIYYNKVAGSVISQQTTLKKQVAQHTAEYTNYTTAYNNFKDTFNEKYHVSSNDDESVSAKELADKVTELQSSVKTAEYNLKKAQKTAQISSLDALTQEKTDLNTASNAGSTYDLTVSQLGQAVTTQQESCDTLQNKIDNITSAMNNVGIITSPCDGIVATVTYTDGASVTADQAMMTISRSDSVSLSVSVSEDDITSVEVGQEASIELSAYDDQSFDALVESITAEPARSGSSSVSYTVTVRMTGSNTISGKIYTGMSGEATLIQKRAKDVLYIPNRAVTFENGVSSVLVKGSDGNPEKRTIVTGFSNGTSVAVTDGLEEGETVLTESAVTAK